MKKKLLIIALFLTVASSTWASQGKGYREYGESYHISPGSNFKVEEMPAGTFDAMFKKKKRK